MLHDPAVFHRGDRSSATTALPSDDGARILRHAIPEPGRPADIDGPFPVSSLNRNLPIRSLKPFDEQLGATLARRSFITLLLGVFAALAIALAGVGIYGVLNYWVNARNREIAVRIALGASRGTILRWAGWQALRLALAGIALGAAGAWSTARLLKSMVYGVSERSPVTMLLAIVPVLALAVLAAGLPLWRATRVNVSRNLREA